MTGSTNYVTLHYYCSLFALTSLRLDRVCVYIFRHICISIHCHVTYCSFCRRNYILNSLLIGQVIEGNRNMGQSDNMPHMNWTFKWICFATSHLALPQEKSGPNRSCPLSLVLEWENMGNRVVNRVQWSWSSQGWQRHPNTIWMKNKFCCCKLLRFVCSMVTATKLTDIQDNQILSTDMLSSMNSKTIYLVAPVL